MTLIEERPSYKKQEEETAPVSKEEKKINFPALPFDPVDKPKHYNVHPSGIECIQITECMNFCLGNALKYLWRADNKNGVEDLEKAVWYIRREIARRERLLPIRPVVQESLPSDEDDMPHFAREKT